MPELFTNRHLRNSNFPIPRLWRFMRLLILTVFLVATVGKTWKLATVPNLEEGLLHKTWFNIAVVEVEILFCAWLLSGFRQGIAHFAAIFLFASYFCFSLFNAVTGQECGCFGSIPIKSSGTALVDAIILVGLLLCPKIDRAPTKVPFPRGIFAVQFLLTMNILLVVAVSFVKETDLAGLGTEFIGINGHRSVIVKPEQWKDGDFPLLPHIEPAEIREQLKTGKWTIILYQSDCSTCRTLLEGLTANDDENIILVEVPPFGEPTPLPKGFPNGRLSDKISWVVRTPLTIKFDAESENFNSK